MEVNGLLGLSCKSNRLCLKTKNYSKSYIPIFQYFYTVQIVAQKPKEFYNIEVHKNQVKGSWKRGLTAGGRTNFSDNKLSRIFATNPQYLIKNEGAENCKCVVALSQSTMGIKHDDLLSKGKAKILFLQNSPHHLR